MRKLKNRSHDSFFHLDAHIVLEHCPQVSYACSSNVNFQGWFPVYTHFLAVLTSLTHSDNLMNWNTIAFRSAILHYVMFLFSKQFLSWEYSAKPTRRMWILLQGQLFRSCRQPLLAFCQTITTGSRAIHGQWVSSSVNTKYGNPLMCMIMGTHAPSESIGERKYFIFPVILEVNLGRSLKPSC